MDDTHVMHWKCVIGSCKDEFATFFAELNEKLGEASATIYMDNATSHRKAENFANVQQQHKIKRFDAAYSPELNPVEGCFSVIKAFIKSQLRSLNPQSDGEAAQLAGIFLTRFCEDKLASLVQPAITKINRENLRNFYRHVDEWILKACNSEPFTGRAWFS